MSAAPHVVVRAATRTHRAPGGRVVTALAALDLDVPRGAFLAVAGASGCGKTTLLALLGALDRPTQGSVRIDGVETRDASDAALVRVRRRVGFVFQHAPVLRGVPLWENVAYPLVPLGVPARTRRARGAELLARVGLGDRADDAPEGLSGGELQRVGVARALVGDPALVLADEPTSQLDADAAGAVLELLRGIHAEGRTIVVASHQPEVLGVAGSVLRLGAATPAATA